MFLYNLTQDMFIVITIPTEVDVTMNIDNSNDQKCTTWTHYWEKELHRQWISNKLWNEKKYLVSAI